MEAVCSCRPTLLPHACFGDRGKFLNGDNKRCSTFIAGTKRKRIDGGYYDIDKPVVLGAPGGCQPLSARNLTGRNVGGCAALRFLHRRQHAGVLLLLFATCNVDDPIFFPFPIAISFSLSGDSSFSVALYLAIYLVGCLLPSDPRLILILPAPPSTSSNVQSLHLHSTC